MSRFLLRRRSTGMSYYSAKLSRYDVEEIRRWARTEGFGLPLIEQVRALQAQGYPLAYHTLLNVLQNDSFHDPTYNRLVPWTSPETAPVSWRLDWLTLILIWRLVCVQYWPSRS